jgi:hypothetical protein
MDPLLDTFERDHRRSSTKSDCAATPIRPCWSRMIEVD